MLRRSNPDWMKLITFYYFLWVCVYLMGSEAQIWTRRQSGTPQEQRRSGAQIWTWPNNVRNSVKCHLTHSINISTKCLKQIKVRIKHPVHPGYLLKLWRISCTNMKQSRLMKLSRFFRVGYDKVWLITGLLKYHLITSLIFHVFSCQALAL